MTVHVGKNSDINAIIPPYASLPGSPKPHGTNTASVNWLTLGKSPSYQKNPSVSVIFCELGFFQPKIRFESVWPHPEAQQQWRCISWQLSFSCVWLSLGISAGELWDSAQSAFKVLRGNLRHNPLLWEHWHKQNKTDMGSILCFLQMCFLKLSKEI